jgi:hypothetical protein
MVRKLSVLIALLAVFATVIGTEGLSYAAKPTVAPACKQCHPAQDKVVRRLRLRNRKLQDPASRGGQPRMGSQVRR